MEVHNLFSHFHSHDVPEEKLIIQGGKELSGHVTISGSKNSSLALLAATLCCNGISKFQNVPVSLSDIQKMILVLQSLGGRFEYNRINGEMFVETNGVVSAEPDHVAVSEIRGGFFVLGPLLSRFGEAVVALPGGCDIGARPVDLYIRGLHALGALVEIKCGKGRRLRGGSFYLDYPSVGATNTLMMAATLAHGVTKLSNVAQEPEVNDLAQFLIKCGAEIDGAGTSNLLITGKHKIYGCDEHVIMPDRIEACTFAIAAAITRSCLSISPVVPSHLTSLLDKLKSAGCRITQTAHDTIHVSGIREENGIDPLEGGIDIQTGPYPEFPTDLQPQMLAFLTTCNGQSVVRETVFEGRMGHVRELQKMGAKIQVYGNSATIYGGSNLCGSSGVLAHDLRGGASLVLAGLAASGTTEIDGVFHIDRGYEDLQSKLQSLGANVKRSSFNYYNI
ncbi:hypothetical protein ACJIZ3_003641 [Penstemon smallii]|uniref:UDP-N-acetylglucosamine 1-carboxyvinyltransferase n=1 Tax=Penstemon smallii TaxID=265156 RepID=A0ABD3UCS8_9LAMI